MPAPKGKNLTSNKFKPIQNNRTMNFLDSVLKNEEEIKPYTKEEMNKKEQEINNSIWESDDDRLLRMFGEDQGRKM